MFVGKGFSIVLITSLPEKISDEIETVRNVLNKWNERYSNDRKKFLFFDESPVTVTQQDLNEDSKRRFENADLAIAICFSKEEPSKIETKIDGINANKHILYYIIDQNKKIKLEQNNYRICSKEEFGFYLTCDICAFDDFNPVTNIKSTLVKIDVEKVKTNDDKVTLTYNVCSKVFSPDRYYRDRVSATSGEILTSSHKIEERGIKILNKDQFEGRKRILEYEAEFEKQEFIFEAEMEVSQTLSPEKGGVGYHIPYFTENLLCVVRFNGFNTEDIEKYRKGEPVYKPDREGFVKKVEFGKDTILLMFENISAESSIAFEWDNRSK
ncbi:hypothetical protein J6Z19_02660 [bacterium]|nr:hypothetical protein [bacterium]